MTYDKPTFKTYNRACDQWAEWKRQAAALPIKDLKRHASVSTENNHSCVDCFCCAAVQVLEEKQEVRA